MTRHIDQPLYHAPEGIIEHALGTDRRVLLFGQPGIGKSTFASRVARALQAQGRSCWCIGADPGSPRFGLPGAVCLGHWQEDDWQLVAYEALCTLDAGRFRLPLVEAVRCLLKQVTSGTLLVDGPGVVRGVAAAELLFALQETAATDLVLALVREGGVQPLLAELQALPSEVFWVRAAVEAHRPGKRPRARERTRLWDAWLCDTEAHTVDLARIQLIGTPPPVDVPKAWSGRQIALLDAGRTVVMGEALALDGNSLRITAPHWRGSVDTLLIRDAMRSAEGYLNTARPFASATLTYLPPPDMVPYQTSETSGGPRPLVRIGIADAVLVNGVNGDPLLHLRLRHQRRSLLFDLGMPERLSARIAHQVSDVFISHAHIDHIGGFLWLLRSRMGDFPPCRLYGPPGLAANIQGLINGVHWDRIGERGPQFEVAELHGEQLLRFHLQAGRAAPEPQAGCAAVDGVLLDEPAFRVRAVTLDHGTPVLAFAFEPPVQIGIRKERLVAHGWPPGPWLGMLKDRLLEGDRSASIALPDGSAQQAGQLGEELTVIKAGKKLVYATDLADTSENRRRLIQLAHGSHTFFCEAPFVVAYNEQAQRKGHLTTRACAEIATAADVEQLIPFHFSRRYSGDVEPLYEEIADVCSRVVKPAKKTT
jgi:ribonuclease BN (tRNA processing enzyme)